ncbi:MAG: peptidoglycan DD-metalloendopeptidase family protein [Candidatus Riflebacteria bacterium]|nr:peptidoglycan DD-metalloendopeptidase family protein [Candidatus Riflebacteria bacterium]
MKKSPFYSLFVFLFVSQIAFCRTSPVSENNVSVSIKVGNASVSTIIQTNPVNNSSVTITITLPPISPPVTAVIPLTSSAPVSISSSTIQAPVNPIQSPVSSGRTYTVQPGDTLWKIAKSVLGSGSRYPELVQLNKSKYPSLSNNPNLIYPGWILDLPENASTNPSSDLTGNNNPAPAQIIQGMVEVNTYLNVRKTAWGEISGKLENGAKVEIVATEGEWYKIKFNDGFAYVHKNYVTTPNTPATRSPVRNPNSSPASNANPVTAGRGRFGAAPCTPMPSRVSSEFGPRDLFGHDYHYGIDLPINSGTRLNALGDGVVSDVGYESGGGRFIKVRYDNGLESVYCHLQSTSAREGQRVNMGQEIAKSDNTGQWTTGPHLHMGIKRNGSYINPRSAGTIPLPPR